MEEQILDFVARRPGTTFVELEQNIDGFRGEGAMVLDEQNIVLWPWVSPEACEALVRLRDKGLIEMRPVMELIYFFDGRVPRLPIAKHPRRHYKTDHWLPVALRCP